MTMVDLEEQLERAQVEPWLVQALTSLARNEGRSLDPYLVPVGATPIVAGTKATCRTHFVRMDPQGNVRVPALANMLVEQVVDYCIPRSRIDEARAHFNATGSPAKVLRLQREAKDLFTKIKTSGEGGELLLYALLEIALGLPQILCKMALKTNPQVHYHGVDGVHAQALANATLAIYWGEAKLYAKVNQAIDAAMNSLAPYLLDPGGGEAERDVLLLRDNVDTGDPNLTAALARYFTEDTLEASQLVIRGACLIGFSMRDCTVPFGDDAETVRQEVAAAIGRWHDRVGQAIAAEKIDSFELEVFLVPLPSVQSFRDVLLKALGVAA